MTRLPNKHRKQEKLMFIVLLKFSENKANAKMHMEEHNAWIKKGFDDEVFLLAGSIVPNQGGTVIAHNISLKALKQFVDTDPFVSEKVVSAEIIEISHKKVDERFDFLTN